MNANYEPPTPPRGTPPPPPPRHSIRSTGPHAQPAWQQHYRPAPRNGLAVAAVTLAVLGLFAALVPLFWFPALGLAIGAVACGAVARGRVKRGEATNRRTALTGLVLGLVSVAAAIASMIVFFTVLSDLGDDLDDLDTQLNTPPPVSAPDLDDFGADASPEELFSSSVPPVEESGITSGTWIVGDDIEPGTYRTQGPASAGAFGSCYYARLSGTSGELDDVIANDNSQGPTTVTISASDEAFETNGCQPWEPR